MNLGLKIKELREQMGLSQQKLATELNISRPSITKYERNEREPSFAVLLKISDFFGVSSDYLLGRTEESNENTYRYNEGVKRLEKIRATSFLVGNEEFDKEQESAVNGLLASYLSVIEPEKPNSLDYIYLADILVSAIDEFYYDVFNVLNDTKENENLAKTELDETTMSKIQNFRKILNSDFDTVINLAEKLAIYGDDDKENQSAYFINAITHSYGTRRGKEEIHRREHFYRIFEDTDLDTMRNPKATKKS